MCKVDEFFVNETYIFSSVCTSESLIDVKIIFSKKKTNI